MRKLRIGINGFGRIGRIASRIILARPDVELVAINSRAQASSHAYLLTYDSTYGMLHNRVRVKNGNLDIEGKTILVFAQDVPETIPWDKAGVDIVIEATGKFRTKEDLAGHLKTSRYVVLSAPAKDDMKTLVLGVNEGSFIPKEDAIVSNSSCTTNCLATTLKVIHDNFKVKKGYMTTAHAVTDSQNLLDNSHSKEIRLRRAAYASLIPASTGSAKDIGKLYKDLAGRLICQAIRVPLLTVSLLNLTVEVEKATTPEEVNRAYEKAAKEDLAGILAVAKDELVSKDFTGNPHSSIVDPFLTKVIDGNLLNVYAWYDNEWGYTSRLIDMVTYVGKRAGLV